MLTLDIVFLLTFFVSLTYMWISPDSAGAADGLNLYVYVGNNPLKYRDPTPALRCWIVGGC
jgi:hypothetical protein